MKKSYLLIALVVAGITGCHNAEPVQTVDWYRAHTPERQAKLAECKQNPGELASTPNCVNASKAAWLEDSHAHAPSLGKPLDHVKTAKELLDEK